MEILKKYKNLIFYPKQEVNEIINKSNIWIGVLIAIIGISSFEIGSYIGSKILNSYNNSIIDYILLPLKAGLFFVFSSVFTYLICKLFKGKGNLIVMSVNLGWAWIFMISISISMLAVYPAKYIFGMNSPIKTVLLFISVLIILSVFFQCIWAFKAAIEFISQTMNLKKSKATIVYILSFIPSFIFFDVIF